MKTGFVNMNKYWQLPRHYFVSTIDDNSTA